MQLKYVKFGNNPFISAYKNKATSFLNCDLHCRARVEVLGGNTLNNVHHLTQLFIFIFQNCASSSAFISGKNALVFFCAVFMTTFCISQRKSLASDTQTQTDEETKVGQIAS